MGRTGPDGARFGGPGPQDVGGTMPPEQTDVDVAATGEDDVF